MVFQIIFSLIAIGFIYYLNKWLGCNNPALFTSAKQALDIFSKDFPNTKSSQVENIIYFSPHIVLFNLSGTASNKIGISFTMGDAYISRLIDKELVLESAQNTLLQGKQYHLTLQHHEITLPLLQLNFDKNDVFASWLNQHKISLPDTKASESLSMPEALSSKGAP